MVPETCPWTLEQLQDEDFLPEDVRGTTMRILTALPLLGRSLTDPALAGEHGEDAMLRQVNELAYEHGNRSRGYQAASGIE
jgi:hypothetical protein